MEGGIEEDGSNSMLAKLVQQAPQARVGFAANGVNAHPAVLESKALQVRRGLRFELAKRGHEPAIGGAVEQARGDFRGHGEPERVKILAMLDVRAAVEPGTCLKLLRVSSARTRKTFRNNPPARIGSRRSAGCDSAPRW